MAFSGGSGPGSGWERGHRGSEAVFIWSGSRPSGAIRQMVRKGEIFSRPGSEPMVTTITRNCFLVRAATKFVARIAAAVVAVEKYQLIYSIEGILVAIILTRIVVDLVNLSQVKLN